MLMSPGLQRESLRLGRAFTRLDEAQDNRPLSKLKINCFGILITSDKFPHHCYVLGQKQSTAPAHIQGEGILVPERDGVGSTGITLVSAYHTRMIIPRMPSILGH